MQLNAICSFLNTHHECIPVISTGYSLIKIFSMAMLIPKEELFKKHHFTSLKKGSLLRELFLLIPGFGNAVIFFYVHKKNCDLEHSLECVRADGLSLYYALSEDKSNKTVVDAATNQNSASFAFAADLLRNDPLYVEEKMKKNSSVLRYAADTLRSDQDFFLKMMVAHGIFILQYALPSLLENEAFMEKAIKISPDALKYAKALKKKESFIFKQTLLNRSCLMYAAKAVRKNPGFIERLMRENAASSQKQALEDREFAKYCFKVIPKSFTYFSDSLKEDPEFILELSEIDETAITFASITLQTDEVFALRLIKKNPKAMQFCILNSIESFLLKALSENSSVMQYAHPDIRKSLLFFEKAMPINKKVLKYALKGDLTNNAPFFWEMIHKDVHLFKYAGSVLSGNLDFLRKYLYNDCGIIRSTDPKKIRERAIILNYANDSVKGNFSFLNELKSYYVNPLPFANETLRLNLEFTKNALPKSIKDPYYQYFDFDSIHPSFKDDDEFVFFVAKLNDQILKWATPRLQNCKKIAMRVIETRAHYHDLVKYEGTNELDEAIFFKYMKETPSPLKYMGKDLQNDYETVLECTYYDSSALSFASEELQNDARLIKDTYLHGKGKDVRLLTDFLSSIFS